MISSLRDWLRQTNPGDDIAEARAVPPQSLESRANANSPNAKDQAMPDTWIQSTTLGMYACIKCQLLQRSVLIDNADKMALLTVWDGTAPPLRLNRPSMGDFSSETHDCGVLEQLPDYCVNLVLYGDHVKRAKQLKVGGVYRFSGKMYLTSGSGATVFSRIILHHFWRKTTC